MRSVLLMFNIVVKTRIASRELRTPFFLELRDPLPWLWQTASDDLREPNFKNS